MRWGHRTCPTHTGLQLRPQEAALSGSRARGKTVGTEKDSRRPGLDTKSKARRAAGEGDKVSPQTNCPASMRGAGTCTGQAYRMGGQQELTPGESEPPARHLELVSQSQAPARPESTPRRLCHTVPAATWGPWPRCPAASSAPPAPARRSWRLRRGRRPRAPLCPWRSAVNTAGSGSTRPWRHAGLTLGPSAGHCRPAPLTPAAASTRKPRAGAPLVLERQPALPTLPATRRHAPRSRQVGIPDPVPSGSAFSP